MEKLILNGPIEENCYLIENEKGLYIIDPGSDKEQLLKAVGTRKVKAILLTHGHMDHVDQIELFNAPIYLGKKEDELLKDNSLNCYQMMGLKPSFHLENLQIHLVSDGDEIDGFKVMETPGHTRGSVSYLYKTKVFVGDTLFKGSIGRTDLPTGNFNEIKTSILKLMTLDDQVSVYPGHDEQTTIKYERQNNPYVLAFMKGKK